MKLLLQIVFALGLVLATKKMNDTKDFVLFTEGFLKGALDAEGFTDIEHCIQDGVHIVQDAEAAYKDFKAGDIHDIVDGFEQIADALKTIKVAMSDCSSLKADWEKLEKMAEMFAHPTSLIWHIGKDLIHNGVPIYHEISTAITDYEKKDWKDFGYQTGLAAAHVFVGEETQVNLPKLKKKHIAEFYQGVLEAYGGHFNLEALLECIYEEDEAALALDAAVQIFEEAWQNKSIMEVIPGVIFVVAAVQQFKQGLPICKQIDPKMFNYKEFEHSLNIAADPTAYMLEIDNDLKANGVSVLEDIGIGVKAYKRGNHEMFGRQMGNIIKLATTDKPVFLN